MLCPEKVESASFSFKDAMSAVDTYKLLYKILEDEGVEHDCLDISIFKHGVEHICASSDDFCYSIILRFNYDEEPTEKELIKLLSKLPVDGVNIAITTEKEMKLKDFIANNKLQSIIKHN